MEEYFFITEKDYKEAIIKMKKDSNYFTTKELKNLMQFLMQRQRKVIKNEVKRNKV